MITLKQNGNNLSRGDYGVTVRTLVAVVHDREVDRWSEATEEEVKSGLASWGFFEPDFGWLAPWTPTDPAAPDPLPHRAQTTVTSRQMQSGDNRRETP